jgi:hypothetical protein
VRYSDGICLVLVDTPGFDDTNKSDLAILKTIANWFKDVCVGYDIDLLAFAHHRSVISYRQGYEISGILYLHRITDNRMGGTPRKNLELFKKISGDEYFRLVFMTTTMWPMNEADDEELFPDRESQLKEDYWKDIIRDERQVHRFRGTQESAWKIIDEVLFLAAARQRRKILEIQEELVELSKQVPDTNAGQHLHGMTEELVERQTRLIQRLQNELISTSDAEVLRELVTELTDLRRQQEKAQKDLRKMGPSLFERARQLDRLLSNRLRSFHQGQYPVLLKHQFNAYYIFA